jgi:WD40 repeat protein
MAPLQLAHETLLRRHQLRGSVLPILTMAYNASRQHLLTADEQALRLFSTRKELSVLWLDPESPSPMILLHHAIHDVYIVVYDDQPADHPDACAVQILHASLAPLLRWRPHDGAVAAAVLHPSSGVLVTSGSEGQLRLWQLSAAPSSPGGGSRRGEAEPPKDDLALIVSPVASLNEHQPRGAICTRAR